MQTDLKDNNREQDEWANNTKQKYQEVNVLCFDDISATMLRKHWRLANM